MKSSKGSSIKRKILVSLAIVLIVTLSIISGVIIFVVDSRAYKDYYANSGEQMNMVSEAIHIFTVRSIRISTCWQPIQLS